MCEFVEYTVSRYGDTNVKVAGRLWKETVKKIEDSILSKKDTVITILGQPGMGKTLILNAVKKDLDNNAFIIYLDLVSSQSLSKEAWNYIKNSTLQERIRGKAFDILNEHQKEIGYGFFARAKREFPNWLRHLCEDKKWKGEYEKIEKLYCMAYDENLEGLIQFLKDLTDLGPIGLLIDEFKSNEIYLLELHKIINEVKIPIVVTVVPEVINDIKDSALRRRLDELKIELKFTSEDDKLEILKTYCAEYAKDLLNIEEVENANTVNKLLDNSREAYLLALSKCEKEYKKEECIRNELSKAFMIEDIENASKKLEEEIRNGLLELKDEYQIDYVHERGKRINEIGIVIDLFFKKGNVEYLGDVKLSNEKTVKNIGNVEKLNEFNKDGGYEVRKFIVTNNSNVNLRDFTIISVSNRTIKQILDGDRDKRQELVREILDKLGVAKS